MIIYAIRHGEDTPGFRGGFALTHLTEKGKKQIENAAEFFKGVNICYIVSSDLPRAKESAIILSNILNKDIEYVPAFREYNNGILAGMKNEIADEKYPHYIFAEIDMDERFPEGETPREYFNRISEALNKLIIDNKDVILVTHGGVIDIINHIYNKIPYSNSSKFKRYFDNAEIIKFEF